MFNSFHHTYHLDDRSPRSIVHSDGSLLFGKMPARLGRQLGESLCVYFAIPVCCLHSSPLPLSIAGLLYGKSTRSRQHTHTWPERHRLSPIPHGIRLECSRHSDSERRARRGKVREGGWKSARGKIQAYRVDSSVFPICKKFL